MARPRLNLPLLRRRAFTEPPRELIDPDNLDHIIRTVRDWGRYMDRDVDSLTGASTDWPTPFGNLDVRDGTLTARFVEHGPITVAQATLTFGSATAITGAVTLTLPVPKLDVNFVAGYALYIDDSAGAAGRYPGHTRPVTDATIALTDSASPANNVTAAAPFAWTVSDILSVTAIYLTA